jgi:nucleotide-binding universal stress UspA family protein
MFHTILVPVDLSGLPARLQKLTAAFAAEQHGALHYLYVLDKGHDFEGAAFAPIAQDDVDLHMREIAALLSQLVGNARDAGARADWRSVEGSPASRVIVGQARSLDADLIVMTTHGRHGLNRALNGSVTEEVVRNAAVPVLVLHQP